MQGTGTADPILGEKLQKRAKQLASCLKNFVREFQQPAGASAQGTAAGKAGKAAGSKSKAAQGKPAKQAAAGKGAKAGKAAKDPKAQAWETMLLQLDELVNKSKRCNLEDIYIAVASMDCLEQQALANIIATASTKLLPEKQMNEAALAVKNTLFAAAAAHSYRQQQVPDSSRAGAEAFRQRGLPADCALEAGFCMGQLLRAGYSTAELVQSSTAELQHLRAAGISVQELYSSLPPDAAASRSGVAGAAQLKQAGYTAVAVQAGAPDGAISMWDLKLAGYLPCGSAGVSTAGVGGCTDSSNGSSSGDRHRSRSRSFNGASAGAAASSAQQCASGDGVGQTSCDKLQQQQQQQQQQVVQQQQQQQPALRADAPGGVEYFRHQVKPLMRMQPGSDLPDLLVGTKDKLVLAGKADAAEEPTAMVMLASNPVKLAQQRKKSANGGTPTAAGASGCLMSGNSAAAGGSVALQLPASPAGGGAASRVKQGVEKQQTSRLRTASRETAD